MGYRNLALAGLLATGLASSALGQAAPFDALNPAQATLSQSDLTLAPRGSVELETGRSAFVGKADGGHLDLWKGLSAIFVAWP